MLNRKIGIWTIVLFTIVLLVGFVTLDEIAPAGRKLATIRGIDAVCYFDIAHSILFDHDFNLTNEFERMPQDSRSNWTRRRPETGLPGSVWAVGYSILQLPLLALGTGIDALVGNPADGYSRWAIFCYSIGTLLMVGFGMLALYCLLESIGSYWQIRELPRAGYGLFITFVTFFGTNVGYYAFSRMSHSSTFLLACLFLYMWWRVRDSESRRHWLFLGLLGGFLSICRWQEIFYLAGPLLYDLLGGEFRKKSPKFWQAKVIYGIGIVISWIPQMLEWKAIYGRYLTNPVGGSFFAFPPPYISKVLLSTNVGWFVWTPVTILGVTGLLLGAYKAYRIYVPWLLVVAMEVVFIGSVITWDGGDSFGARYLISSTPLIALGIMTFFCLSAEWVRRGLAPLCALCCVFTVLFVIQFRLDLIPRGTQLTFSELLTDKFHLRQVKARKAAVRQAGALLANGDVATAIAVLESAQPLGQDRDIDRLLERAYRAAGRQEDADAAATRYQRVLASRLY